MSVLTLVYIYAIIRVRLLDIGIHMEDVVNALLAHRIPIAQIARYLKLTQEEFIDAYAHLESHSGFEYAISQNQAVENALFKAALAGNAPSLTLWLKNKAGWDEGKAERERQQEADLNNSNQEIRAININVIPNKGSTPDDRQG